MGEGNTSSYRWQPFRKVTPEERANFWQTQYCQMKSERDQLDKANQKLAMIIAKRDKELSEYRRAFGPIMFTAGDEVQHGCT